MKRFIHFSAGILACALASAVIPSSLKAMESPEDDSSLSSTYTNQSDRIEELVQEEPVAVEAQYIVSAPLSDTVTVTFSLNMGSIKDVYGKAMNTVQTLDAGSSLSFQVENKYVYDACVYVNGAALTPVSGIYTLSNITADTTVSVIYKDKVSVGLSLPAWNSEDNPDFEAFYNANAILTAYTTSGKVLDADKLVSTLVPQEDGSWLVYLNYPETDTESVGTLSVPYHANDTRTVTFSVSGADEKVVDAAGNKLSNLIISKGDSMTFSVNQKEGYTLSVAANGQTLESMTKESGVQTYALVNVQNNIAVQVTYSKIKAQPSLSIDLDEDKWTGGQDLDDFIKDNLAIEADPEHLASDVEISYVVNEDGTVTITAVLPESEDYKPASVTETYDLGLIVEELPEENEDIEQEEVKEDETEQPKEEDKEDTDAPAADDESQGGLEAEDKTETEEVKSDKEETKADDANKTQKKEKPSSSVSTSAALPMRSLGLAALFSAGLAFLFKRKV